MGALGIALSMALLSASALTPAQKQALNVKVADEKIVCKNVTQAGSRIPFRVCRTAAEWENLAKANQDDWTGSRNQRVVGCNRIDCV